MHTSESTLTFETNQSWRPVAYVALQDTTERERITEMLTRSRWTVIPVPTGFHLVQALAELIEGQSTWLRPELIVVDAYSRGCAGTTIAAGLRELGIAIPIVLIAAPGQQVPVPRDATVRVASRESAEAAVRELALRPPDGHRPAA